MAGKQIILKNTESRIINSILSEFAEENYVWRLINLEYCLLNGEAEGEGDYDLDANGTYSAQEISDALPTNNYYLLFATLIAYSGKPSKVPTYGSFMESDSTLIVDINDACYMSVYAKNEDIYGKVIRAVSDLIDEAEAIKELDKSHNDRIIWDD